MKTSLFPRIIPRRNCAKGLVIDKVRWMMSTWSFGTDWLLLETYGPLRPSGADTVILKSNLVDTMADDAVAPSYITPSIAMVLTTWGK